MATKDYVYLALIALSAVVFYLHGYYAGAITRRKRSGHLATEPSSSVHLPEPVIFTVTVEEMNDAHPQRMHRLREHVVRPSIQCVFGHN